MIATLWLENLFAYCLQVGVLVLAGAVLPVALKLRKPAPMLLYWHGLLLVSILLPLLQPWQEPTLGVGAVTLVESLSAWPAAEATASPLPLSGIVFALIFAGAALRLAWLGLGLWTLRRFRQRAVPGMPLAQPAGNSLASFKTCVDVRVSRDVCGPVTFGLLHPVVLLPAYILRLSPEQQEAILLHELAHVRRKDWLINFAEEVIRAILWFHPAIHWLVMRIRRIREQVVDREVVAARGNRHSYIEALVASARLARQDLSALAPLFQSKRYLSERVALLTKEEFMSKRTLAGSLVLSCLTVLGSVTLTVWSFPLQASPQEQAYRLDRREAASMRTKVVRPMYPREARKKRVEGTVTIEIRIDENGHVEDARVISGPSELRESAVSAVRQWEYSTKLPLPALVDVEVNYTLTK